MNEEEKQSLEIIKGLEFYEYEWYVRTDKFEGHADEAVGKVEKAIQTILNLIDKQQKEIEFYKIQELGYIQGYADGKSHKQTAIAIKNENAEQEFIQRKIEKQQKEIEKLRHFKKEVIDIIKYADDTAEPTYWNIRKLLGLGE